MSISYGFPNEWLEMLGVITSKEVEVFPASRRTAEEKGDKNLFNLYFNKFSYQNNMSPEGRKRTNAWKYCGLFRGCGELGTPWVTTLGLAQNARV